MLPDLNAYIDERGRFHVVRFALLGCCTALDVGACLYDLERMRGWLQRIFVLPLEKEIENEAGR